MAKPQLWVKSYPYPNEVAALADLGQQDIGMEIFLGGDSKKNDECMKICQDNYPKTGIELFFYHGEEKRQREVIVARGLSGAVAVRIKITFSWGSSRFFRKAFCDSSEAKSIDSMIMAVRVGKESLVNLVKSLT